VAYIRRQRPFPYACGQVFDLVADIESYPRFVPYYLDARIVHREADTWEVEQTLAFGGLSWSLATIAELDRPRDIRVHSRQFPLRQLDLRWRFEPQDSGCRAELSVSVTWRGPGAGPLGRMGTGWAVERILAAFGEEARRRYGA
jgi:coenzyme Q-binding protein COQ10